MKLKNLRIRLVKPDSFAYTGTMKNTDTKIQETIEYYKARNEKLEIEKEALEAKIKLCGAISVKSTTSFWFFQ